MKRTLLALSCAIALTGCASGKSETPPVCDGEHRRPANPHGSVLAPETSKAPLSSETPGPALKPLSALPGFHESCRA